MLGRYRESVRAWSDPVGRGLFRLRLRPNHLTVIGLLVSLAAAAAFIGGHVRWAGGLLVLAGLCDLLDGSLARASGQVTAFGAFLDSVIDRYSDLVVLLGIVVLLARTPNARGAIVAMAGLVGSVMVSYTKARAESIGVSCTVGMMERPERMLCLIAGALLDLLEPALWVLAVLANLTAIQRILFTRRKTLPSAVLRASLGCLLLPALAVAADGPGRAALPNPPEETERAWARAIAALQDGDPEPAAAALRSDAALESPIGGHLGLVAADALERWGDTLGAREVALRVADTDPRLAPRALLLAARLAAGAGDEAAAQAALTRLLGRHAASPEAMQALYMLGLTAEARGQHDAAVHAYRHLMITAPATAWADGAEDRLGELAAAGIAVPSLSLAERLDRAERLLKSGVPRTAADEARQVVDEAPESAMLVRALRVVADATARLGRHEAAARALELAVPHAAPGQRHRLRLDQARLLLRAGQRQRAETLLARVIADAPEAEAAEALYQRARALDDAQRTKEAAAVYRTLVARFGGREVAAAARWRLGWLAWLRGDPREAAAQWDKVADGGNRSTRAPAIYWRGRALEQASGPAAARPLYAQLVAEAPWSYYGLLAAQRLGTAPAARASGARLPADPLETLAGDPDFARVELLRRLGLVESALEELAEVVQAAGGDPVRLYGASTAYARDERYHMALRIARRHFSGLAWSGDPGLPRVFWEVLYPLGWRDDVTAAAQGAGVDPFLVAAVVREESSYHPRAVSRAGARGLMQLMPATARPLAAHQGLTFGGGDLLDDPQANVQMGAAYLAGLLREFGDPRLAIAAYNAGPGRVRGWLKARRATDLEAWVELIPFDETRAYVKRVVQSWEQYRRIYGEP
jgi:soluble lytic murein transglycosylase